MSDNHPPPIVVPTCNKYLWAMRPFAYLFNIYWSSLQRVDVVGFEYPDFPLPDNFYFHSLGKKELPAEKWSDGLIQFLRGYDASHLVLLFDDYWICRTVDVGGVVSLTTLIRSLPDVLRMDLTTDRLYAGGMFDVGSWGHYDIIETPHKTPYQMSFQAGIWNRRLLLDVLRPGLTPWKSEIEISPPASMRVLGTRQNPVKYINAFKGGDPYNPRNLDGIPNPHRKKVQEWIQEFKESKQT